MKKHYVLRKFTAGQFVSNSITLCWYFEFCWSKNISQLQSVDEPTENALDFARKANLHDTVHGKQIYTQW